MAIVEVEYGQVSDEYLDKVVAGGITEMVINVEPGNDAWYGVVTFMTMPVFKSTNALDTIGNYKMALELGDGSHKLYRLALVCAVSVSYNGKVHSGDIMEFPLNPDIHAELYKEPDSEYDIEHAIDVQDAVTDFFYFPYYEQAELIALLIEESGIDIPVPKIEVKDIDPFIRNGNIYKLDIQGENVYEDLVR